jgi:hypothetical protein
VFIGQVNNVLGYFNMLDAVVKQELFSAYCSIFYGCELWPIDHGKLDTLFRAWRKAVRRIWNLPRIAHNDILPLVADCLPIHDEICKRVISFIYKCVLHDSELIKNVARYGVLFGRTESQVGRNIMLCLKR